MQFALAEVLITNTDGTPEESSQLLGEMRKTMTFRFVPQPPTWLLLGSSLAGLIAWSRRRVFLPPE